MNDLANAWSHLVKAHAEAHAEIVAALGKKWFGPENFKDAMYDAGQRG